MYIPDFCMYANIYVIRYMRSYTVSILHTSVFYFYNNAIFTNFTRGFKEEIINEHFYIQGGKDDLEILFSI